VPALLALSLDERLAEHAATALDLYRQLYRRRLGEDAPADVIELHDLFTFHARPRRQATDRRVLDALLHVQKVEPLLLTKEQAAEALSVSPRTIDRLLADHTLTSIKVGAATRIARQELDEFIAAASEQRAS
jgi:excisionase family DNA binding protein